MLISCKPILVVLLLEFICSLGPNCETLSQPSPIPVLPGETNFLDLSSIFSGYDLFFSSSVGNLTPPVSITTSSVMLHPIPANCIFSVVKPLQGYNKVWQDKAAIIYQTSLDGVIVNVGTIGDTGEFEFDGQPVQLNFAVQTRCFDAQFLDTDHIVISCQQKSSKSLNLIVFSEGMFSRVVLEGYSEVTSGKLLKTLNVEGQLMLLSIIPSGGLGPDQQNNSFISFLQVSTDYQISQQMRIDSGAIGRQTLKIVDAAVDSQGFVYITEAQTGVIRFRYSNTKTVTNLSSFQLPGSQPSQLSISQIQNQPTLFVATNVGVVKLSWPDSSGKTYQYPENQKIVKLQASQEFIALQSETNTYIYPINSYSNNKIARVMSTRSSFLNLQSATNRGSLVTPDTSYGYSLTRGYLTYQFPSQATTFQVNATSSVGNQSKSCLCNITLLPKGIQDIAIIQTINNQTTTESPVSFQILLDNYFIGAQLTVQTVSAEGVTYTRKHVEPVEVPAPKDGQSKFNSPSSFDTQQIDGLNYFRMVTQEKSVLVEFCQVNQDKIVTKVHFSYESNSTILESRLGQIVRRGKSIKVLSLIRGDALNKLSLFNLETKEETSVQVGQLFTPISDYLLTKQYTILSVRSLSSVYIFANDNLQVPLQVVKADFFTNAQMAQIGLFRPKQIRSIAKSNNVILVGSVGSVVALQISALGVAFLSSYKLGVPIDSTIEWDIVTRGTNMLAIFGGSISKVQQFVMNKKYNFDLIGEIDLFGQQIPSPFRVKSTPNFVHIRTSNNTVTTIRLNQTLLGSNHHITTFGGDGVPWFVSTQLSSYSLLEARQGNTSSCKKIYNVPSIQLSTDIFQKQFKKGYNIVLKVKGVSQQASLTTLLQVFNYQTLIQEKNSSYQKIWMPASTSSHRVYLDIDSFIGCVINYQISCAYCNSKMTLMPPLYLAASTAGVQVRDFLYLEDQGVLWMLLTNQSISISRDNGHTLGAIHKLNLTGVNSCSKMLRIQNSVLVLCQDSNSQFWINIKSPNPDTFQQVSFMQIPSNFSISSVSTTVLNDNRIYILDNDQFGLGNGIIRVFKVLFNDNGIVGSVTPEISVDYANFGLQSQARIQGLEVLDVVDDTKILIVTINTGVAYGSFNSSVQFVLTNTQYVDLNSNKVIGDYILDDNRYLQIKLLDSDTTNTSRPRYSFLLTVTTGAHLQIRMQLQNSNGYIAVINSLNKYGSQMVVDTLLSPPYNAMEQNLLIMTYYNSTNRKLTYALYRLPGMESKSAISFKAGVEVPMPNNNITPSAYLFRTGPDTHKFVISVPSSLQSGLELRSYDASYSLAIQGNYNSPGSFSNFLLTASNAYSSAGHTIDIQFGVSHQVFPWYAILTTILGGLLIIGMGFGVFKWVKRRSEQDKKISLVTEDEEI